MLQFLATFSSGQGEMPSNRSDFKCTNQIVDFLTTLSTGLNPETIKPFIQCTNRTMQLSTIFFTKTTVRIRQSKRLNLPTNSYLVCNVDTMLITQHYENAQN